MILSALAIYEESRCDYLILKKICECPCG
jgi:hypothetical protein